MSTTRLDTDNKTQETNSSTPEKKKSALQCLGSFAKDSEIPPDEVEGPEPVTLANLTIHPVPFKI